MDSSQGLMKCIEAAPRAKDATPAVAMCAEAARSRIGRSRVVDLCRNGHARQGAMVKIFFGPVELGVDGSPSRNRHSAQCLRESAGFRNFCASHSAGRRPV